MSGSGSLPHWMKDSHTATQEQFKQQAEDRKAADQRHQDALKVMEETMRKERADMQEAMEKMQNKNNGALKTALVGRSVSEPRRLFFAVVPEDHSLWRT